jgi:hypothetical protein
LWQLNQYSSPFVSGEPAWVADLYLDNGQPPNSQAPLLVTARHLSAPPQFNELVNGDASGNVVQGNRIGTDVTGTVALGNRLDGVNVSYGAQSNLIGGSATVANIIAFNGATGVAVSGSTTTGNAIRGNSIFSNGALGIDLGADGITPNHVGAATGPNNFQNYPVLTQAQSISATTRIVGSLNSLPNTNYTVDFYASATADPSGFGQGQVYLGAITVTTDASGNGSFDITLDAKTKVGEVVTATANDPSGNTSEFSAARTVTDPPVGGV